MWPCYTQQPLSLGEVLRWQMLIAPRDQSAFRCSVSSPSASEVPSSLEEVHFLYEKGELFLFLLSRIRNQRVDGCGVAVQAAIHRLGHWCPHLCVRQASRELRLGLADVPVDIRSGSVGLVSSLGYQDRLSGGGVPEGKRAVWKLLPFFSFPSEGRLLRLAPLHCMSCYPRTVTFSQCGTLSFLSLSEAVFPVSLLLRTKLGSSGAGLASGTKAPASQGLADLGGLWEFASFLSERSLVNAGGSACSSSCWLPTPLQVRSDQGVGLIEEVAGSANARAGAPGSLERYPGQACLWS